MSVLNILKWPSAILETKAKEVTIFDSTLKDFVCDMHETMKHAKGIGLAANQVGSLQRIITLNIPWTKDDGEKKDWHNQALTFINPEIIAHSKEAYSTQEGCLSFPGIFDFISRYKTVTVKAYDENGQLFTINADELLSVCLQHEIDHLDGIVFLKRMSRLKAKLAKKKIIKNRQIS